MPKPSLKSISPNFFRAIKPGDVTKGAIPVEENVSWVSKLGQKVGQGAVALGGQMMKVLQGGTQRGASDKVKAVVGASGLQAMGELIQGKAQEKVQEALMANAEQQLSEQAKATSIAAAAERSAAEAEASTSGQVTDQGQREGEEAFTKQAEARRRQNLIQERAATAQAGMPAKKSGSFVWTVLDLTPGFGQVAMLRNVPKLFGIGKLF